MVFRASDAQVLTTNAITNLENSEIQQEVTLAEQQIRNATALGLYKIDYNATIIGNPKGPPAVAANVTDLQQTFYNLFIDAGYIVGFDGGRWLFNWASAGPESRVYVYSFRTTQEPGPVHDDTIAAIHDFFTALVPTVNTVTTVNNGIDLTVIGAADSTFYEYTIVADQENDDLDHSDDLTAFVIQQGIGYNSDNCHTYKMI